MPRPNNRAKVMKSIEEIQQEPHEQLINRVWIHMYRAHRYLYPKMEKHLRKHGFDSPFWHEALVEIERAGEEGIRSTDLLSRLHMAQFNMSRHLSRMEKKGLIERVPCEKDRRAHFLRITPYGTKANKEIWPHYMEIIQEELNDKLTKEEAFQFFSTLIKLYR
jgi:DNA-binding MarR family transcriptional regulator